MVATTITNTGGITLSTDVAFRAWGSAISAAILATGWVQTADTGQVNWTTVTAPTANTFGVYEIWKMGDSLQATDPVFLKVMYSRNASNGWRMQTVVGTASDGAGTITSAVNTNVSVSSSLDVGNTITTPSTAITHYSYVMGDTSSLVLFLSPLVNGASSLGGLFVVERRRAADGTAAAYSFYAQWVPAGAASNITTYIIYTHNLYAQPGTTTAGLCRSGYISTAVSPSSGIRNNSVPAFPCFTGAAPELGGPSKWLLGTYQNDIPLGQTFQVVHYGATQTFMSVGNGWLAANTTQFSDFSSAKLVPAVRID